MRNTPDIQLAISLEKEITGQKPSLEKLEVICRLMKERATFINDILTEGQYLFDKPNFYDDQTISKKWKEETRPPSF